MAGRKQVAEELSLLLWRERELIELLHETELMRAVIAAEVAEELDLAVDATLQEIVDRSPQPWQTILEDHRQALSRAGIQTRSLRDFLG